MKKTLTKVISFFLAVMLLASTVSAIDLYVDMEKIETDTPPTIIDGRTLVPLRAIFEAIGAEVEWDGKTRTATGTKGGITVSLQIDNATAYVNGESKTLDVPAQIINGRTMVPARFISESMGCDVKWDGESRSVYITTAKKTLYDVIRVVDGDTIVVNYNGTEETVRLIGVDTPESVHPTASKNTEAGVAASKFTTFYLSDKQVELEFDVQERDQYGRLLAYVYLDGEMLNEKLLRTGYASIATYPPNVKYVNRFSDIVKNRDSSIPSGKYLDGYMEAPKIVYNEDAQKTGMAYSLLYAEGKVTYRGKTDDGTDYVLVETKYGYMEAVNSFDYSDFNDMNVGDTVSVATIYLMTDKESHVAGGVYIEALSISSSSSSGSSSSGQTQTGGTDATDSVIGGTIYITPTGKRYHYSSSCAGRNAILSTLEEAISRGLTPCGNCVH